MAPSEHGRDNASPADPEAPGTGVNGQQGHTSQTQQSRPPVEQGQPADNRGAAEGSGGCAGQGGISCIDDSPSGAYTIVEDNVVMFKKSIDAFQGACR